LLGVLSFFSLRDCAFILSHVLPFLPLVVGGWRALKKGHLKSTLSVNWVEAVLPPLTRGLPLFGCLVMFFLTYFRLMFLVVG
jgi:hypothetical protein